MFSVKEAIRDRKYYLIGACIYAFLIPLPQKLVSGAIILWFILSLFSLRTKQLRFTKIILLLPALYLTYLLSMLVTGNFSSHILEHKLSLITFPLIFLLNPYTRGDRNILFKVFITGLIFSGGLSLIYALIRSLDIGTAGLEFNANVLEDRGFIESIRYGGNYFFGRFFSVFHQTVYYALYVTMGIAILLFNSQLFKRQIRFILLAILLFFLFLISNKAAFIALVGLFVYHISTRDISAVRKAQFLGVFLVIAIGFAWTNPRLKNSFESALLQEWKLNKDARYGFETRFLSWDAATSLIKEKPVRGYGAASAQDALNEIYEEKGYRFPLRDRLNAHNQFLQIWLENGLPGLIIWGLVIYAIFNQVKRKNPLRHLYTAIALIILVNALFESILNRFSGISIVSFAVCLILSDLVWKNEDS